MKKNICCCESNDSHSKSWFGAICTIVGFLSIATLVTLWICKKYRKCTRAFHDDGSIDCDCSCIDEC